MCQRERERARARASYPVTNQWRVRWGRRKSSAHVANREISPHLGTNQWREWRAHGGGGGEIARVSAVLARRTPFVCRCQTSTPSPRNGARISQRS